MSKGIIILIILLVIIVAGGVLAWQYLGVEEEVPIPQEFSCEKDEDCVLAYTGMESCAPCDSADESMQCVSPEEAERLGQERINRYGDVTCDVCADPQILFRCVCEGNSCAKTANCQEDEDCYSGTYGNLYKCKDSKCSYLEEEDGTIDWEGLIPAIEAVIGPVFLDVRVGTRPMTIAQEGDITGDGIPEALVFLGQGGAYTEYLTLVRIKDDSPVVAQFKKEDGEISPLMFLDGASVMNGASVGMLPEKNAIYSGSWSRSVEGETYGGLSNCIVEAYQWNPQAEVFDFSQSLSDEMRPGYCQKAES